MSHHRPTPMTRSTGVFPAGVISAGVFSAQWTCAVCRLDALPVQGPSAVAETELLAGIHDRVHHGGARTAELLLGDTLPALYSAAS